MIEQLPMLLIIGLVAGALVAGGAFAAGATFARSRAERGTSSARQAFSQALQAELERARRHERSLTLVRAAGLRDQQLASGLERFVVRRTDEVFEIGDTAYLIAPETGPEAADDLRNRLAVALGNTKVVRTTVASFPEDGLTSGALLEKLEHEPDLEPRTAPSPVGAWRFRRHHTPAA